MSENVTTARAWVPMTKEMLDDSRVLARVMDDMRFHLAVGRARVNPNPMPHIRLFRRAAA